MLKKAPMFVCILCFAVMLCVCGCSQSTVHDKSAASDQPSQSSTAQSAFSPIEIDNFNSKTTYKNVPQKVVVFKYNQAEILAALGVADKVVAFREDNQSIEQVKPEYKKDVESMPKPEDINTSKGLPTLENILSVEPDLMILDSYYFNVPTFGKTEDFRSKNVNLYVTEGSYVQNATIQNTYDDIMNLGKIFNKEAEAVKIVDAMKEKASQVTKGQGENQPSILVFDDERKGLPAVAAGSGLANDLIKRAGGENVFADVQQQWATPAWEEIVSRNPDYIVILEYPMPNDAQRKIDLLKSKPELADVKAIKNESFIVVPLSYVFPGMSNADAVVQLSQAIK